MNTKASFITSALVFFSFFSTNAMAQYTGPVEDEGQNLQQILENPKDEQLVRLQGYLIEKKGDEKYVFSDGEHQIQVEIDQNVFPQQPFNEKQKIEITGELEKDFNQDPEIEVEALTLLAQ